MAVEQKPQKLNSEKNYVMTFDSVGNSLSLIRNANLARHSGVSLPFSKANLALAKILTRSGFCRGWRVVPKQGSAHGDKFEKQQTSRQDYGVLALKSGLNPKRKLNAKKPKGKKTKTKFRNQLPPVRVANAKTKQTQTVVKEIQLGLKYVGLYARPVLTGCKQISRPSLRLRRNQRRLAVYNPFKHGLTIISTSGGLMTHQEARKQKLGGEILFSIW